MGQGWFAQPVRVREEFAVAGQSKKTRGPQFDISGPPIFFFIEKSHHGFLESAAK